MNNVVSGLEFGPHGLKMDVHLAARPGAPAVLYIHGGGFARGDRKSDGVRIQALVDSGLTIAAIDYRLAPDVRYPAAIRDVVDAARALRSHLALSDTQLLGAIGASAGGYLATMAALLPESGIGAVSPWFANFDFFASSRRSALEQRLLPVGFELNLVGSLNPEELRAASTINHDLASAPPFLILHGDRDRIVSLDQAESMHEALLRAGRTSTLVRVGGAGHEDAAFDTGANVLLVAAWLRSVLQ